MRVAWCASVVVWASILGSGWAAGPEEPYVGDLQSPDASVRRHAAVGLGRSGDRSAVPGLIAALEDPAVEVRRAAAEALGRLKDRRAVAPLVEALAQPDTNLRFYAAYALGEIKDPGAAEALLEALDDPQWCVRDQAAWALRELRDPKIVGPLVASLRDPEADLAHLQWLLRHVAGSEAVGPLAALLADPQLRVRVRAVNTLAALGGAAAVAPLIRALDDEAPSVRRAAIGALVELGDDRAKKPLKRLAAREQDPAVLAAADEALFQMSREKDLVAHWTFDDRSTEVARDVTDHGNDGEIRGCEPVEGKVRAALRFAPGKYIELGRPPGLPIGNRQLTIMAWAKTDADRGVVVARGGAFCGFSLYILDGAARFGIHRVEEGPAYIAAGKEKVTGDWVHLAGVVKEDCVELYVNGKLAATEKTPGPIPGNCGQGMEIGFDTGNSPAEITDPFQGIIDEVKVYHAALSEEEIAEQCRPEDSGASP